MIPALYDPAQQITRIGTAVAKVAVILFLRHGPRAYTKSADRHRSRTKAATVTPSTFRDTEPLVLLYNLLHSVKDLRRS